MEFDEDIGLPDDDQAPLELLVAVTELLLQTVGRGAYNPETRDIVEKKLAVVKDNYVS